MPVADTDVVVIGAGLMGHGIAQCAAQAGCRVRLWGTSRDEVESAIARIGTSVAKLHAKGRMAEPPAAVVARIEPMTDLERCTGAGVYIESVVEKLDVKQQIFRRLDALAPASALIASNTSTIPIARLAAVTRHPDRCLGMHFTSPVPLMPVAEVIRTAATTDDAFARGTAFVRALGKEPIAVQKDIPGFVFNRVNLPGTVEAIRLVEMGAASVEDIDKAMRLGFGRPMGPFETADMVGLDTGYYALCSLHAETGDDKFRPPDLLRRQIEAGHLGRKTGRGWYEYDAAGERRGMAPLP
ncbi:MAG: 3-hydroxyacyl-CoA dehydrogenase family protein [Burkholderiales bacterium]|nr:3-hydroxyacyl-CoA dehydrogenase family protein [Burkholderiales bacterium]